MVENFWDVALDHGHDGTKASMAILKLLCLTFFSDRCCPIHDCSYIIPPLCEHFMESHTLFNSNISPDYITNLIISCTSDSEHFMSLLSLGLSLNKNAILTFIFIHLVFHFIFRVFHSSLYGVYRHFDF